MSSASQSRFEGYVRRVLPTAAALVAALAFGLSTKPFLADDFFPFGTLSLSFFLLVPSILGFLTVGLAPTADAASWAFVILAPWIPTFVGVTIAAVFQWEVWFCIFLALPLFLALSSTGGVAAKLLRSRLGRLRPPVILLAVAIPYATSLLEARIPITTSIREVHSQIMVAAPAEVVWSQVTDIAPIQPQEHPISLFHILGLPRPIQAKMACTDVGCVRTGMWEDGLVFEGRITEIVPEQRYWVTLEANLDHVVPTIAPLSQIGAAAFDMIDDGYVVERVDEGHSILHLYSSYRVSTPIKSYASFWLDTLLRDIQRHLLIIEKNRSEQSSN